MPPAATPRIQIVLPKFRCSYMYLTSPRPPMRGQPVQANPVDSYEVLAIFDQPEQMQVQDRERWHAALTAAKQIKDAFFANGVPANYRSPLRDGTQYNTEHGNKNPEFNGKILLNLKSKGIKPGLCLSNMSPLVDPSAFYSGMFAIADGSWFGYNKLGNAGISFGLNNVMKVCDGEPLSNVNNPTQAFRTVNVAAEYGVDNAQLFQTAGALPGTPAQQATRSNDPLDSLI